MLAELARAGSKVTIVQFYIIMMAEALMSIVMGLDMNILILKI